MKTGFSVLGLSGVLLCTAMLGVRSPVSAQTPSSSGWTELNDAFSPLPTVTPSINPAPPYPAPPLGVPAPPFAQPSNPLPSQSVEFESSPPDSQMVPLKSSKKDRRCRRQTFEAELATRFNPSDPNPSNTDQPEPPARYQTSEPDYRLLQREPSRKGNKVYLKQANLETLFIDHQPSYWLTGQLENFSGCNVYSLRVHYRILQGLSTVEAGSFHAVKGTLDPDQIIRFRYPVHSLGDLEISFLEWKYGDGTLGVANQGLF